MADARTVVEGDLNKPKPAQDFQHTKMETAQGGSLNIDIAKRTDRKNDQTRISRPDEPDAVSKPKLIGWLYSFSRVPQGEFFVLREGRTNIGRASDNDIILGLIHTDNDRARDHLSSRADVDTQLPTFNGTVPEIRPGKRSQNDDKTKVDTDDQDVSAKHCYILHRPKTKYTFVKDVGSTNGTYLNGEDICDEQKRLADGDQITIGAVMFTIRMVKEALSAPKEQQN
jgi:pSer/pThr/pTyr-binding forkhead associated (FHA) protein